MAKIAFVVTKDEFAQIIKNLHRKKYIDLGLESGGVPTETPGEIATFLQSFMISVEHELALGVHYDYELLIDGGTILLDNEDSQAELEKLVTVALAS